MSLLRRTAFVLPLVAFAAVACGSADSGSESEAALLPAPSDPMVYDASAETTRDVGIVKWGVNADASSFRGYNRRNEIVVQVSHTITTVDDSTRRFELVMSGSAASGKENIEIQARWASDGQTMEYVSTIRENTFAADSVAAKILAHLGPDAEAMAAKAAAQEAGSLTTKSIHPMDQATDAGLVAPSETPLIQCCSQLTRESVALSAIPGSECGLVTPSSQSTVGQGELSPKAIVLGADGKPTVKSPWDGKYHIVDHHCHNAAAENSSKTDGYIACVAESSSTSTQGHTVSWGPDPSKAGTKGAFCGYEPQANGGTASTKSVCCWQGNAGTDGAPLFDTTASQDCVKQLCLGQADFPGWFRSWFVTPPKAFPAGSKPPLPNDCPGTTNDKTSCTTCCTKQADNVYSLFGTGESGKKYKPQIDEYRTRCAQSCLDLDLQRQAKTAADKCAKSLLDELMAKATAKTSCGSNDAAKGNSTPKK